MQPVVDAAAKAYAKECPGATINVQGGGSGTGLTQVATGAVDIGNSDVTAEEKLKPDQSSLLVNHIVLKQGWVMVVNPSVTGITNLTTQQVQRHLDRQDHQLEGRRRTGPGHRPDPSAGQLRERGDLQEDRPQRRRRGDRARP